MKKSSIVLFILMFSLSLNAQIKMHSNGRITFQTLSNSTNYGIVMDPEPSSKLVINVPTYLKSESLFTRPASAYQWMNCAKIVDTLSVVWVICKSDWTTTTFFVYGNGEAYAKKHYTISGGNNSKGSPHGAQINGEEALTVVRNLEGRYFDPENGEVPDLENNENIVPEAVDAMYADFNKRSVALDASVLEEFFPEAVRTDPQNRLCMDYQSVVTMLVEALKEQQRQIEELRQVLNENRLHENGNGMIKK